MKFSVIIPSYGQAQYLTFAIESALNQTYKAHQIIVVDDGSVDGSLEIAQEFAYEPVWGNRVTLVRQVNKGLASARNAGIMNATGDYCFFLDADDYMSYTCLEKINHVAEKTGADVIAPSITCFDDRGNTQDTILMENPTFDDFKVGNRLAYCAAIKRSVLLETGGYSPKMDIHGGWEDLHLWYDLMNRGKKFKTIQEPLVNYRLKENSMWKDAQKNSKALWEQIVKDFPHTKDHVKP